MTRLRANRKSWRRAVLGAVLAAGVAAPAEAYTLWSNAKSYLGPGYFFGPGAFAVTAPLFPVTIRSMGFTSGREFITPYRNNGAAAPNITAEADFPPVDGLLSDGTRINENVDLGTFVLAGTRFLPAVVAGGEMLGQQMAVTGDDGNLIMAMDLALDLGIGPKGVIRMPFYGTTGTVTVPAPQPVAQGAPAPAQAGRIKSGETVAGRIGDFNNDGYIDGTLVAAGTMPADSPVFPGQPWVMARNFETDIPIKGLLAGSPEATNQAYGIPPGEGLIPAATPLTGSPPAGAPPSGATAKPPAPAKPAKAAKGKAKAKR
jgi:hypothetical protein